MHNDPFPLLDPVFRFLDRVIADQGLYLYMAAVWLSPFLIVWILRGGFWRKRRNSKPTINIVVIHRTAPPPPLPPVIDAGSERWRRQSDDEDGGDSFAA